MAINSIRKAARVLRAVSEEGEITLSQIAKITGFPTATAQRLCETLLLEGLLARRDKSYSLGPFAFELGKRAEDSLDLLALARPHLEDLREKTGENANLAVLDGADVVYLACAESKKMMRTFTVPGARVSAYATGVGKVLLAALPDDEVIRLLGSKPFRRFTPRTVGSVEELLSQLHKARREGCALDEGEREEDVICVAAPVADHSGKVIAAISISGPSSRLNAQRLAKAKDDVKSCAFQVSLRLGRKPMGEFQETSRDISKEGEF